MSHYLVTVTPYPSASAPSIHSLYLLAGDALTTTDVERIATMLLFDSVVQQLVWTPLTSAQLALESVPTNCASLIEIAYRPGVTDNEAESILVGARHLGITQLQQARALRRYLLTAETDAQAAVATLANDLVQAHIVYAAGQAADERFSFYTHLLTPPAPITALVAHVPLREADDETLLRISREGILSLDLAEMQTIQRYFAALGRDPTDGELETIAQTWSEHCSHKTFKAQVHYRVAAPLGGQPTPVRDAQVYPAYQRVQHDGEIDSLIKTFLMAVTDRIVRSDPTRPHFSLLDNHLTLPPDHWVRSAFVDNAGIIAFGADHELSFKVETHNHPSALEPFGGANTGVGGVIRDILGVSAQPIANTDVLCFGMPDQDPATLTPGVHHPRRICTGVVAGVRDYGNKLGIPTVNGAVLFDAGYTANPLVFCGTVGLAPRDRHPRNIQPGDAVVVVGGRTGRDGIHGATFSSAELTHTTATDVGSAVQIGNPITEKTLVDVVIQARDRGLYSGITDCGAGGLSSSVGEMGAECGVHVELRDVPLKYAGLQPWEIWLSEAQERMVLAVPPQHLATFLQLCADEDVEATPIGTFTADGMLRVTYAGESVVALGMAFLHDGRPQRQLAARWEVPHPDTFTARLALEAPDQVVLRLLAHPTIASKERIVRTYDHEVGGATVVKPLVGVRGDGPGDAAVLQPLAQSSAGFALGCGINPRYGRRDPYWMALACVDEAMRNVVAVGADPGRVVILDNFCWGDPRLPDRMAGLVRAVAGCYDAALGFNAPFISGKDSLNNEYRDAQGNRVSIPPTLLISALAHVPDVGRCVTMDLKHVGNRLYVVGVTRDELGESMAAPQHPWLPQVDLEHAAQTFAALHGAMQAGLVAACHDISEGGLAIAAAEMVIAGQLGLELDLAAAPLTLADANADRALVVLFSESTSRFLVEVPVASATQFEQALGATPLGMIGTVIPAPQLVIGYGVQRVVQLEGTALERAWAHGLAGVGV